MCWVLGFISFTHLNSVSEKFIESLRSPYPFPCGEAAHSSTQVNKYFLQSRYCERYQEAQVLALVLQEVKMLQEVSVEPLAHA